MKISPVGAGFGPIVAPPSDAGAVVPKAPDIRKLRMTTNASPDRFEGDNPQESSIPPNNEPSNVGAEETKPLSPQLAEIARQRRALQVKERELADKEKRLATQHASGVDLTRIKTEPLKVLQEAGVTYEQLTEAILANQGGSPEIHALKAEIKALKEGVDKNFMDRDTQAEQQVLAEMKREALKLAGEGDAFEMVRETRSIPQVMKLIERTYREQGEILEVSEALQLVEDELIKESLRIANIGKVQSRMAPAPVPQQPQQRTMRTLTNRDTARSVMSSKARAIAAFNGTLKK